MKNTSDVIIELRRILSQKIIPQVTSKDSLNIILARLPLRLPEGISMKRQPAPSLHMDGKYKSSYFLAQYKKEAMHAICFPYFCYVVEGEIDMRLGIPPRSGKSRNVINNYHILTLPKQTLLLIPPGVFYPDGSLSHWERPSSPPAHSQMFWMRILPNGVACHLRNTQHHVPSMRYKTTPYYDIFVPDLQLAMLTEMLTEDLQSSEPNARLAAHHILSLMMLRVLRGLGKSAWMDVTQTQKSTGRKGAPALSHFTDSSVVERACNFIRYNLVKPFSIEDVANTVHVSPSHLARLFRAEMKTSIKQYALEERLERAQFLLRYTDMSIQEIARSTGYVQAPQFNHIFKKIHHVSPSEYRNLHRKGKMSI